MLACMEPDLQQHFENVEAYDMIESLKSMFQTQARTEKVQCLVILDGLQAEGR